jgi:hypothetical protein
MQRRMLEAVNKEKELRLGIMVKDGKKKHLNASAWGVTDKAQNYMLMMPELGDLDFAVKQWKGLPTWNPLAQVGFPNQVQLLLRIITIHCVQCVVVCVNAMSTVEQKDEMVEKILTRLLSDGLINSIVVYYFNNDKNLLIAESWFRYLNTSCGSIIENIHKIDECRVTETVNRTTNEKVVEVSQESFNQNLFPRIPRYFHDCFLNATVFVWEPFVVRNDNSDEDLIGLEVKMLKEITNQMEMKINFKIQEGNPLTVKISSDNQTGIYRDLLQKLVCWVHKSLNESVFSIHRTADVMLGGLSENRVSHKILGSSIPYFQDDLTWCVKKSDFAPTWLNVFIIFNSELSGNLLEFQAISICIFISY